MGALPAATAAFPYDPAHRELTIGGLRVPPLADIHDTPLFLYDADMLRRSYHALTEALRGFAEVYYSIKANPNPAIVRLFVGEGAGIEVASAAEYEAARAAGATPERILFAGPGKRRDELEHVVGRGIGEVHLESMEEIALLGAIGERRGVDIPVAIRVNPSAAAQGGAMRMGGRSSPFGFDEEALDPVLAAIAAWPRLELEGIHLFAGTQILDAEVLADQWAHGLRLAAAVAGRLEKPLRTIDLGGGLGVPYFSGDTPLDLARLRERAADLADIARAEPLIRDARIIVEPGRFLTAAAGIYVARVIAAKISRGARYLVTDGGMHHHLAASGNLGQVIKRDYPIVAVSEPDRSVSRCAVVGPLCTPLDTLARQAELPDLQAGELIAILQSGAYALTASPIGFLGHPTPAEVLVDAGVAKSIRRRGDFTTPIAVA